MVDLLPNALIPVILDVAAVDRNKPTHSITWRKTSPCGKAKDLKLNISGTRPLSEAIVTAGALLLMKLIPVQWSQLVSDFILQEK